MTELTSAVREAQADADRRFGDGPVPPWEPPPVLSATTRRRLAAVALASALATALLVAMAVAKTGPAAEAAPAASMPPVPAVAPHEDEDQEPANDETPPAPVPSPAAPSGVELERRGALWHLSAQGAERHAVLMRLAEASGSTLHGTPDAVASTRPVHLHWQGRSLAQLWPLVLGPELNFALQCRRERCEVWILGAARPGAAPIVPALPSPAVEPPALPLPMPGMEQDNVPIRD